MLTISIKITLVVVLVTPVSLFVAKFIATRTYSMFKKQSETELSDGIDRWSELEMEKL